MRHDLMVGIDERCVTAVIRRFDGDASLPFDARGTAAAHIACQTGLTLGCLWDDKRSLRRAEARTFRMLGGLAVRAGLSESEVIGAMRSGIEGALATARDDLQSGPAPYRTQLGVLDHLKSESEAVAAEVEKELRQGMQSPPPGGQNKAGVLLRLLDGRLPHDELGAAASRVGLDACREHGLVLLVDIGSGTAQMEAAAQDIESAVPEAVDLGLTSTRPVSRRVVFPVLTHGRWIEARTTLHDIATKHGVLAIAPTAAQRLGALVETCRAIERDLGRVVDECGYTSGIIDPACVALPSHQRETGQLELPTSPTVPAAA